MPDPPRRTWWTAGRVGFLCATLAGMAFGLSTAPRDLVVLAFAGGPLLCLALESARSPATGFGLAWAASFVGHAITLAWLVPAIALYGAFGPIGVLALTALVLAAQAVPFALAGAVVVALRPAAREWVTLPVALPVALALVPVLFPWNVATIAPAFLPYQQCAELSGQVTASVPMLYTGTALAFAARTRSWRVLVVALVALVGPLAYGYVRLAQVRAERASWPLFDVGVVQPSFDVMSKLDPATFLAQIDTLHEESRRLEAQGAELVVWPETAYPLPVDHRERADDWQSPYALRAGGVHGPLLVGAVTTLPPGSSRDQEEMRNSVLAVDRDGRIVAIVDKRHPVPFSESAPLWDELPMLRPYYGVRGITPGRDAELLTIAGTRVLVTNCYEDILAPAVAYDARARPGLLVNVTNDMWFGDTDEPAFHDSVARFRAIETRTDFVRVTNTGVSAFVSATGEPLVVTRTLRRARFVAHTHVRPERAWRTPYVVLGDWLTPALSGVLLGWAFVARRRPRT